MNALTYIQFKQQIWARQKGLIGEIQFSGTDPETYSLPTFRQNLFMPLSETNENLFGSKDREEMRKLCSTSALCLNIFQYWQGKDIYPLLNALRLPSKRTSSYAMEDENPSICPIKLKEKFQFDERKRIYPHPVTVDAFIHAGFDFIIETQFTEPYRSLQPNLAKWYIDQPSFWKELPHLFELAKEISSYNQRFYYLDAARLITEIIALKKTYEESNRFTSRNPDDTIRRRFCLLYLWYDVLGEDGIRHKNEIEEFAKIAENDFINFREISIQKLITKLVRDFYKGNEAYCDYLAERYL